MNYSYTENLLNSEKQFMLDNMMGPNAVRVAEELTSFLPIDCGTVILDLACGTGLSSIFLAEHYGATVSAADLWISPEDNRKRFTARGLGDKITAYSVDASKGLPFAPASFDMILCIDGYHYFGCNDNMLPVLLQFVKRGGFIAVAIPGLKKEFIYGIPQELTPYINENVNFHSLEWWMNLWRKASEATVVHGYEMKCHSQAWAEWLQSSNPYAVEDIAMMQAENGNYYNHIGLIARRK